MFDINYLITSEIEELLLKKDKLFDKAEILIKLGQFQHYYPNLADKITKKWYESTEEVYTEEKYFRILDANKDFIFEYTNKIKDFNKIKNLITDLCLISDGINDYDTVISLARKDIYAIVEVDDFEFINSSVNSINSLENNKKSIETTQLLIKNIMQKNK